MTIIIACKTEKGVLFGADNDMSVGSILVRNATPKMFALGEHVCVAVAGHAYLADIVRHSVDAANNPELNWPSSVNECIDPPKQPDVDDAFPQFDPANANTYERKLSVYFRKLLKDQPEDVQFHAIIAVGQDIYTASTKGVVMKHAGNYFAVGHPTEVALGAMYALFDDAPRYGDGTTTLSDERIRQIVQTALEACEHHIEAIRPPWSFAETKAIPAVLTKPRPLNLEIRADIGNQEPERVAKLVTDAIDRHLNGSLSVT